MSSKDDLPGLGAISADAEKAVDDEDKQPVPAKIEALEGRIASLEAILEQKEQNPALATKLDKFVDQLIKEQSFLGQSRWAVGGFVFVIELLLIIILILAIFCEKSPLLKSDPAVVAAVILGLTSAMIFLIVSFAKGVFRAAGERYTDSEVPPTLAALIVSVKHLGGSGK